jgi:membrane protein
MSERNQRISKLEHQIRHAQRRQAAAVTRGERAKWFLARWFLMLNWKILKDDVTVRAESLAFLMTFSLLPIIAGLFFIVSIFTKFGMVQETVNQVTERILSAFPDEHRVLFTEYVVKFRDGYLDSLSSKSGSLGIFALLFLFWVGLRAFNNMDRTLNFIWFSERQRPFLEKVRNFVFVAVAAPFVTIGSLSVPLILAKTPVTRDIMLQVPFLKTLLNLVIPSLLTWGVFTMLYKYLPVRRVKLSAALWGGLFTTVMVYAANAILQIYFKHGTQSLYGKAAIVPLMGLWIYWVWIIVILGAEVSYLIQNQQYLSKVGRRTPSFFEGECLLAVLLYLQEAYNKGENPVHFETLFNHTLLESDALRRIIRFLERRNIVIQVASNADSVDTEYSLAREMKDMSLRELLNDFLFQDRPRVAASAVDPYFNKSLEKWLDGFENKTIADFTKRAPAARG